MTRNWHNPDRPTPAELAAWVDGELDGFDAARVEAWLRAHPDDVPDADSSRLVGLFRDVAPPEPSAAAWDRTLARIAQRTQPPRRGRRWSGLLFLGLGTAAALAGIVTASFLLAPRQAVRVAQATPAVVLPPGDDNDEPFPVARAGEIDVMGMDARDAHRVLVGNPLLEPFDVVSFEEVEMVSAEIDPDEGTMPMLQRGHKLPMVVLARADEP